MLKQTAQLLGICLRHTIPVSVMCKVLRGRSEAQRSRLDRRDGQKIVLLPAVQHAGRRGRVRSVCLRRYDGPPWKEFFSQLGRNLNGWVDGWLFAES